MDTVLTLWIWSQVSGHTSLYTQGLDEILPVGASRDKILEHLKAIRKIVDTERNQANELEIERRSLSF